MQKFLEGGARGQRKLEMLHENVLYEFNIDIDKQVIRFWGDPDHDPFPGFLKYSCRRPRIKHENPWQRFELCECFLVCITCAKNDVILDDTLEIIVHLVCTVPRLACQ